MYDCLSVDLLVCLSFPRENLGTIVFTNFQKTKYFASKSQFRDFSITRNKVMEKSLVNWLSFA